MLLWNSTTAYGRNHTTLVNWVQLEATFYQFSSEGQTHDELYFSWRTTQYSVMQELDSYEEMFCQLAQALRYNDTKTFENFEHSMLEDVLELLFPVNDLAHVLYIVKSYFSWKCLRVPTTVP